MAIPAVAAAWFFPFVLPICVYVAYTDLSEMRIKNHAVDTLLAVFVVVGLFVLPPWSGEWVVGAIGPLSFSLPVYLWQLSHFLVVLIAVILLNSIGAMGGGDAKFMAAASPFIWVPDILILIAILTSTTLGAFAAHRLAKYTRLRQMAPHWESWNRGKKFPMGLVLSGTLTVYLILGIIHGS